MRNTVTHSSRNSTSARSAPQSVGRIFHILDLLADKQDGATLSELAIAVGAPKTSLVGLLNGLTGQGLLSRDETGRYFLGPEFLILAMRAVAGRELASLARPYLAELVDKTGETAVIGTLTTDSQRMVYVEKVESSNPIRYAVTVGEERELYCTALGKILLANFDEAKFRSYLSTTRRTKFTPSTLTLASELSAEVTRIRKEGIARTCDERFIGASGLAAPVYSGDGKVVAGILMAGPSERMKLNTRKNEKHLREVAAACTRALGGERGGQER